MPELKLSDLLRWTSGRLVWGPDNPGDLVFSGLSSDTRTIEPGSLFLALRGQQHDGHRFLAQALAAGAAGLLIEDETALARLPQDLGDSTSHSPGHADHKHAPVVILAGDSLRALQDIAAGYRLTLPARVIGISGSVGKTSTRQMISACLQTALAVHQTAGNLNNEIGLPQTLLLARPEHQALILEMGMRAPGEIGLLSRIARPDIAVLTCIGFSHIGRLGSQAAILAAKAEILEGLQPGGLLILNADDPLLLEWGRKLAGRYRLAWITAKPDRAAGLLAADACFVIQASQIRTAAGASDFTAELLAAGNPPFSLPVSLPFPGAHHVNNALFGLAAAHELGVGLPEAAAGAASCRNTGNRQRIIEAGGILIMDDSYNASPESMLAALQTLAALAGGRRRLLAALGGMLELGDYTGQAHFDLGTQAAGFGFSRLLLTGPQSARVAAGAHSIAPALPVAEYPDNLSLAAALMPMLLPGDCLLIKGSRGFAMEVVTEAILRYLAGQNGQEVEKQTC